MSTRHKINRIFSKKARGRLEFLLLVLKIVSTILLIWSYFGT
jgi:hypothetical protein